MTILYTLAFTGLAVVNTFGSGIAQAGSSFCAPYEADDNKAEIAPYGVYGWDGSRYQSEYRGHKVQVRTHHHAKRHHRHVAAVGVDVGHLAITSSGYKPSAQYLGEQE